MSRTLIHTEEGVNVNGNFFSWEDFDRLEPSYHWDEQYPQRIYRVDGERPSSIDPSVMLPVGAHILIDRQGRRYNQVLPWAEGDSYCAKTAEYLKKNTEYIKAKEHAMYRADIEAYKEVVRSETVKAKTAAEKSEVESILQKMDDNWNDKLKLVILGRGLEKYYGWEAP